MYQDIFKEIVFLAIHHQMVGGQVICTDSTHLKANINKNKFINQVAQESSVHYLNDLEQTITLERAKHGQKPLKQTRYDDEPPSAGGTGKNRNIKTSTTDPESGCMHREGKPKGFFYLDHRSVDHKFLIITDTHVMAGNVHDSRPYLARLDYQIACFGYSPHSVGLDAGYATSTICHCLEQRGIALFVGYRRQNNKKGYSTNENMFMMPRGIVINVHKVSR